MTVIPRVVVQPEAAIQEALQRCELSSGRPRAARDRSLFHSWVWTQAWHVAGQRASVGSLNTQISARENVECSGEERAVISYGTGERREGAFLGTWESPA